MEPPTDAAINELSELNRGLREGFAAAALHIGPQLTAAFDQFRDAMAKVRIDLGPLQAEPFDAEYLGEE